MAHDWNENTYTKQFDGTLRRSPKSQPVAVTTNLRLMNDSTAREVRIYAQEAAGAPGKREHGNANRIDRLD